jgi:hypothetical protein
VHEVKGREDRIGAIARKYAASPESTLVVSPDNRSRVEINAQIHRELQRRGLVDTQEHTIRVLAPRQEMTGADRSWAQRYQIDDIVHYSRASKETGIGKAEYARVIAVQGQGNMLTVLRDNGEQTVYDPRRQMGVSVYRAQEKAFAIGDRVQFTAPNRDLKVANRELGILEGIASDGSIQVKLDGGRRVEFQVKSFPHLDHGYAVTSHSSQGQTAERVLIHVDTDLGAKDLLNHRMAYVSVSRGQWDAQIFTNDRGKLSQTLSHDFSHQSAYKPEQAMDTPHPKMDPLPALEHDLGLGLGMWAERNFHSRSKACKRAARRESRRHESLSRRKRDCSSAAKRRPSFFPSASVDWIT